MSEHIDIDIPKLQDWAIAQHNIALRAHHRVAVVIAGDEGWCQKVANIIVTATELLKVWWISETGPLSEACKPAAQARTLLGHDTDAIVFNAWSRFDPDALAAVSGTISGGGFLLLLTPSFEDWLTFADPDNARITVYPLPPEHVGGRYLKRLVKQIRESDNVSLIEQDRKLPVPINKGAITQALIPKDSECRTADQLAAVQAIEKVALGRRRRPLIIISDRGRGKTSSLGIAAARLLKQGLKKIIVTAPRYVTAELIFDRVRLLLPEVAFSRGLISLFPQAIKVGV